MRAAGANAVIGLTHLFMAQDKKLAGCADFDLILGGHEHTLLQSSSNGTPIFKMTADARELGKFNLNFDSENKKLTSLDWEVIPVTDEVADAPEFAAVFEKYKDLLQKLAEPVGRTGDRTRRAFAFKPHEGNKHRKLYRRHISQSGGRGHRFCQRRFDSRRPDIQSGNV